MGARPGPGPTAGPVRGSVHRGHPVACAGAHPASASARRTVSFVAAQACALTSTAPVSTSGRPKSAPACACTNPITTPEPGPISTTSGAGEPDPGALEAARTWIDACYESDDPADVVGRLETHADPDARLAAIDLRSRSPLSVAVTLEAVRRAAAMDSVADVLAQDLVLARSLAGGPDFVEGVRAQVVDKDRTPRWRHARVEDVTRSEVLACFE